MDHWNIITQHLTFLRKDGKLTFKNTAYKRQYWEQRGISDAYDWLVSSTSFLPEHTSLSVRYYFVEHQLTSVPLCVGCHTPINIPKSYSECLPTLHAACVRQHVDHKIKQTMLDRYGGNPMFDQSIVEKHRRAIGSRDYEVIASKVANTKKAANPSYGTAAAEKWARKNRACEDAEHKRTPAQRHIAPDILAKINDRQWLADQYTYKSAKQIAREQGVNKTIIQNRIHSFGIPVIKRYSSDVENEIADYVASLGINTSDILRNHKLNGFELDIYIPNLGIAIEHHGLYWHREQKQPKKNVHLQKYRMCRDQGITLIQIWGHEWATKRAIVESKIAHMCGAAGTARVYARQCAIRQIPPSIARDFCEQHHIQGYVNASIRYGMFYNDVLVAVMTFGKSRYNKAYDWELLRYCTSTVVVGGASRLWSVFKRNHNPASVISYSNNRFGHGRVYDVLGFTYSHSTSPDYYYVNLSKTSVVHHRSQFQKHKLREALSSFDPHLTEYQNMLNNNYDRIWDAGNQVFVWEAQ